MEIYSYTVLFEPIDDLLVSLEWPLLVAKVSMALAWWDVRLDQDEAGAEPFSESYLTRRKEDLARCYLEVVLPLPSVGQRSVV